MYCYSAEKPKLFTEDGQETFLRVRDAAKTAIAECGAFTVAALMRRTQGGFDTWMFLACIDRMVELGELNLKCSEGSTQSWVYGL